MKASSQSEQAAVQPEQASRRAGKPCFRAAGACCRCRNNRWPAAATKDLGESAQTAQLGEKTLGEINTRRDKKR